ncbi:hypothetical protein HDU97_002045 [Phlyctochytrium planicorne]|nr:hypothetical protein HDU97_002045 [Phlyctochytrium planicorne]
MPVKTEPRSLLDLPIELVRSIAVKLPPNSTLSLRWLCRATASQYVFDDLLFALDNLRHNFPSPMLLLASSTGMDRRSSLSDASNSLSSSSTAAMSMMTFLSSSSSSSDSIDEQSHHTHSHASTIPSAPQHNHHPNHSILSHPLDANPNVTTLVKNQDPMLTPDLSIDWSRLNPTYMVAMIMHGQLVPSTFASFMGVCATEWDRETLRETVVWRLPACLVPTLMQGRRGELTHEMVARFPEATERIRKALYRVLELAAAVREGDDDDEEEELFDDDVKGRRASWDASSASSASTFSSSSKPKNSLPYFVNVDFSTDDFFAIRWAAATDDVHLVSALLDHLGAFSHPTTSLNPILQHLLRHAVRAGSIRVVRFLLYTGRVDPTYDDDLAVREASERGFAGIVLVLLRFSHPNLPKVDPQSRSNYCMRMASQNGHNDVVKVLLDTGRVQPCALHWPASRGHAEIVRMFVETGRIDPNHEIGRDGSALVEAAEHGFSEVVDILLSYGLADGAALNAALITAAVRGHVEICKMIVVTKKITSAVMPELVAILKRSKELYDELMPVLLGKAC